LYSSRNIRVITYRRMRWSGYIRRTTEKEECVQNRKGRDQMGDLCLVGRITLKQILKICRMDSYAS